MAKKRAKTSQDEASAAPVISPEITPMDYIVAALRPLAVPIADLTLDPRNARTHDERNLKAIAGSLRQYQIRKPVIVQIAGGQKIVRAGNGTVQAALANGWTHVPAVMVEEDDQAATGFAIADNRTAELSGWDEAILQELLSDLSIDGLDEELARMVGDLDAEINQVIGEETSTHVNRGGSDPAEETGSPTTSAPPDPTWKIIITCQNEGQQKELLERLQTEGLEVKALIA